MRVLVTGATGFIGRHAIAGLAARGLEVHAASRQPMSDPTIVWHVVDLFDRTSMRRLVAQVRPTHLLHLAWTVTPGAFWTTAENLAWVGVSLDLLRAFGESGGRRVVIAGSCAEYAWDTGGVLDECSTPLRPATLYGVAKDALHRVVSRYTADVGLSMAWGRLFFVYGPDEPRGRLVPSVTVSLLRGEEARCTDGSMVRDYLHAADAGDAFAALLASDVTGAVNVASGRPRPVRELIELLGVACGHAELLRLGALPERTGDPAVLTATTSRLNAEVGWTPRISLDAGVRATVQWWRDRLAAQT